LKEVSFENRRRFTADAVHWIVLAQHILSEHLNTVLLVLLGCAPFQIGCLVIILIPIQMIDLRIGFGAFVFHKIRCHHLMQVEMSGSEFQAYLNHTISRSGMFDRNRASLESDIPHITHFV
jgi:hypothetical protein